MTHPSAAVDRRTGAAALTAGVLMFASVAIELVWNAQRPDGSVSNWTAMLLFLGGFLVGTAALVVAAHGLGRGPGTALSRAGRAGRGLTLAGAALLTAFGLVYLTTALATGAPLEAAFWLFLLGFVLLVLGSVPLALGLRRSSSGGWWAAPLVAGIGAVVAMTTSEPWHELGLFTFDAAWAALGLRLLATSRRTAGGTSRPDREAAPSRP